ncbi:hypothetical protein PIB30_008868 [Stylosanthes scabra]|uniref:Uncharacterized protein n=1 Tax=Stylosanthes scabra TaxID=79078 RepID=A0ABU6Z239_9FABA|nr:hypothetical protein [Stylosanthes scabra]
MHDNVKEFGLEVYSVQSHPNLGTESSVSIEASKSISVVGKSPMEEEKSLMAKNRSNLNCQLVIDPIAEEKFNDNWVIAQTMNVCGGYGGDSEKKLIIEEVGEDGIMGVGHRYVTGSYLSDLDPMRLEAHNNDEWVKRDNGLAIGLTLGHIVAESMPRLGEEGSSAGDGTDSLNSCPYPPGFGPCSSVAHGHRNLARALELSNESSIPQTCASDQALSPPFVKETPVTKERDRRSDSGSEEEKSDVTWYLINREAFDEFDKRFHEGSFGDGGPPHNDDREADVDVVEHNHESVYGEKGDGGGNGLKANVGRNGEVDTCDSDSSRETDESWVEDIEEEAIESKKTVVQRRHFL